MKRRKLDIWEISSETDMRESRRKPIRVAAGGDPEMVEAEYSSDRIERCARLAGWLHGETLNVREYYINSPENERKCVQITLILSPISVFTSEQARCLMRLCDNADSYSLIASNDNIKVIIDILS